MCLHFQWFTINTKSNTPFTVFSVLFFSSLLLLLLLYYTCKRLFVLWCCVCWLYGLIGLNCNSNRHCKFQLFTFPIHLLYENIFVYFFIFWVHQTERTTARVRARENKGEFWPTWLDWFQWCLSSTLCGIIIGFVLYEAKVVLHLVRSSVSDFFFTSLLVLMFTVVYMGCWINISFLFSL